MELEEAEKILEIAKNVTNNYRIQEAIEKFLNYIDNSISKEVIEEKVEELKNKQEEMTRKKHNADNINDCYTYGDEAQKAMYQKEILEELLEQK